jgi:hypothetical protein
MGEGSVFSNKGICYIKPVRRMSCSNSQRRIVTRDGVNSNAQRARFNPQCRAIILVRGLTCVLRRLLSDLGILRKKMFFEGF